MTIYTRAINLPKIDPVDQQIIDAIKNLDGLSTSQIAPLIGLSSRSTRERLKRLIDLNYVYESGTGPYDPNKKYKIRK